MRLPFLVQKMYEEALNGNEAELMRLNKMFETQLPRDRTQAWVLDYDNLRQSCVMSMKMPALRETYLQDATRRLEDMFSYKNIPKAR